MTAPTQSSEWSLEAPRTLRLRQRTLPELDPDFVRIRFLFCGICGTDLSRFEARATSDYPASLGHEFVGTVRDVGARVEGLAPGDIVTSDINYRCGVCDQCRAGRSHLCREGRLGLFTNYGFAELADYHASYLVRVDGATGKHLALSEPLSCVLHAVRWATLRPGDRILVLGAGGLGLCMAFALCNGAQPSAFEITDEMPSRLARIDAAVEPTGRALAQPEGEYDVVFDVSGTEAGLRRACTHIKAGGRLCLLGHLHGYSDGAFLMESLIPRDITFTVSFLNGERENFEEAVRLLRDNWTPSWAALIETVPFDQLQEAFERRPASPWCKTIVRISDGPD